MLGRWTWCWPPRNTGSRTGDGRFRTWYRTPPRTATIQLESTRPVFPLTQSWTQVWSSHSATWAHPFRYTKAHEGTCLQLTFVNMMLCLFAIPKRPSTKTHVRDVCMRVRENSATGLRFAADRLLQLTYTQLIQLRQDVDTRSCHVWAHNTHCQDASAKNNVQANRK